MLASVYPDEHNRRDVVRSTDGGLTFSAPKKINDDPSIQQMALVWDIFRGLMDGSMLFGDDTRNGGE
jgi:hypothetical protein